jgi:hypothetical protein
LTIDLDDYSTASITSLTSHLAYHLKKHFFLSNILGKDQNFKQLNSSFSYLFGVMILISDYQFQFFDCYLKKNSSSRDEPFNHIHNLVIEQNKSTTTR